MILLSWPVEANSPFTTVVIESGAAFAGPFTLVSDTVPYADGKYTHAAGTSATFYRLTGKTADDLLAAPSVPKKRMQLDLCRVYGYLKSPSGFPVPSSAINIRTQSPPMADANLRAYLGSEAINVVTGLDGFFDVSLVQASVVTITAEGAGILSRDALIPAAGTADFATLTLI